MTMALCDNLPCQALRDDFAELKAERDFFMEQAKKLEAEVTRLNEERMAIFDALPATTNGDADMPGQVRLLVAKASDLASLREWPCEELDCTSTLGDVADAPSGDEEPGEHSPVWFCGRCWDKAIHDARDFGARQQREADAKAVDDPEVCCGHVVRTTPLVTSRAVSP